MAHSVSSPRRNHTSESGVKPTCRDRSTDANDPQQTFSLKQKSEDDAERTVRAGLELIAAATYTNHRFSRCDRALVLPTRSAQRPYSNPSIDTLAVVISVGHRTSVRPFATAIFCVPLTE